MRSLLVFDSLIVFVLVCFCWFPSASSQVDPETKSHQIHRKIVSRQRPMGHFEVIHVFLGAQHTHIHGAPSQFAPLTALSEAIAPPCLIFFKQVLQNT